MSDESTPAPAGLRVLAVDDEAPARAELAYLLGRDDRIAEVHTAGDGAEALRIEGRECGQRVSDRRAAVELDAVALAIIERNGVARKTLVACDG